MNKMKKFRIWSNKTSKYYYVEKISDIPKDIDDDCQIEYFIGLQDKKGVDIYEGDIVECYTWFDGYEAKPKHKTKIIVEVEVKSSIHNKYSSGTDGCQIFESILICGNIHLSCCFF